MKLGVMSEQEIDLAWILAFYRVSEDSISKYKDHVIDAIRTGSVIPEEFTGMTRDEVDKRFFDYLYELEYLISFDLISRVEALIRDDFKKRALKGKRRDIINKKFHELLKRKEKVEKVSLARDILDLWKKHRPETSSVVGDFKGVLNLRHWIAHGRFGEPKLGAKYTPENVYAICEKLLDKMFKSEECR